eukprot:s7047_g3.t1
MLLPNGFLESLAFSVCEIYAPAHSRYGLLEGDPMLWLLLSSTAVYVWASRIEVQTKASSKDSLWEFELTGSWDIAGSIEDDRVSVLSTRDDEMYRIYDLQVKTGEVPHFTDSLKEELEAIPDPLDRTRERAMILSNGQKYLDLGLSGKGWFKHAGILEPSVLTVATEGKSLRELTTKVLQKAMSSVKKKVEGNWTTIVEDGVFHIGAHYKGANPSDLPQNHYHLMSPSPITAAQVAQIREILQAQRSGFVAPGTVIWCEQKLIISRPVRDVCKMGGGGEGKGWGWGWGPMPWFPKGFGKGKGWRRGPRIDPAMKIWIGNLPEDATWKDLQTLGNTAGTTRWVEVFQGKGKGTGMIAYKTAEEAAAAMQSLPGQTINGQPIQAYDKDADHASLRDPGKFLTLDTKLLAALTKVARGELSREILIFKETEATKSRAVRGRQVLYLFDQYFKTNEEAMDKEWQKLVDKSCWLHSKVREFRDVSAEAIRKGVKTHFGRIFEICSIKGDELPEGHPDRKWKGRSVFQGNRVSDEHNDHAIFSELGSSPASMEAAKVIDVFGGIWEKHCEDQLKTVGWTPVLPEIWQSIFYHGELDLLLVIYVDDFKMAGPANNLDKGPANNLDKGWKTVQSVIDMDPPEPFGRYFGCNHFEKAQVKLPRSAHPFAYVFDKKTAAPARPLGSGVQALLYWEVDAKLGAVVRHHVYPRKRMYVPTNRDIELFPNLSTTRITEVDEGPWLLVL